MHLKRKKIIYKMLFAWIWLKWKLPWTRAWFGLAHEAYKESELYKERVEAVGEELAFEMFVNCREYKLFISHVPWQRKLLAIIAPYNFVLF